MALGLWFNEAEERVLHPSTSIQNLNIFYFTCQKKAVAFHVYKYTHTHSENI